MKSKFKSLNKSLALDLFIVQGMSGLWGQAALAAPAGAAAAAAAGAAAPAAAAPSTSDFITGAQMVPWILAITAAALALVALVLGTLLMRIAILKSKKAILINEDFYKLNHGKTVELTQKKNQSSDPITRSYVVPIVKSLTMLLLALGSFGVSYSQPSAPVSPTTQVNTSAVANAVSTIPQPIDWSLGGNRLNFLILGVIFIELLVIFYFAYWLKTLLIPIKPVAVLVKTKTNAWWDKFNKSVEIEHEQDVQLDHDYDGIKELNNALPPWWIYGFYLTILFACVYLYRYHIAETAPLQVEELNIATHQAEKEIAIAMASMANKVDENSIEYKPEIALLDEGKGLFAQHCKSCHGEQAQGASIGPNLIDIYWIHGGGIKDIFKTIKNGVQEKGMIPWGQSLSNKQIAAVATFVKSLQGSSPNNAKAPQGLEFKELGSGLKDSLLNDGSGGTNKLN